MLENRLSKEDQQEREATLAAVREALEDVAAGRTRDARQVLEELARKYNLKASPQQQSEGESAPS
jgi:predicted transcriptional regulator